MSDPRDDDDDVDDVDDVDGNRIDDDLVDGDFDEDDVDGNAIETDAVPAANARAVLEYLARAVVEDPDAVTIHVEEGRRGATALNVTVGDGDMGRVIGKRGRVAQSIRAVVRAAAVRDGVDVDVEFVD